MCVTADELESRLCTHDELDPVTAIDTNSTIKLIDNDAAIVVCATAPDTNSSSEQITPLIVERQALAHNRALRGISETSPQFR